jgi:hypothetical protein
MIYLLVLTCVVILPLASVGLDLYWLEAARTVRRIIAITQPPDPDPGASTRPLVTAAPRGLPWRWPAPMETPAAPTGALPHSTAPHPGTPMSCRYKQDQPSAGVGTGVEQADPGGARGRRPGRAAHSLPAGRPKPPARALANFSTRSR